MSNGGSNTNRPLVWVPGTATSLLAQAPPGLEVVATPIEPLKDPRRRAVEAVVVDFNDPIAAVLKDLPRLRYVQGTGAGTDHILPHVPPGVVCCSARGGGDVPVSEWILSAILSAEKSIVDLHAEQLRGEWNPRALRMLALETVLILGSGSIGRAVADRLGPFGCEVVHVARRSRPGVHPIERLGEFLPLADIVVSILPLTESTARMIDGDFFGAMKSGALLVNAGRGGVVDTEALISALESRKIRAVLDVTDPEPLPSEHRLRSAPNVLISPHVAGLTGGSRRWTTDVILAQLERFSRGDRLENVVTDGY